MVLWAVLLLLALASGQEVTIRIIFISLKITLIFIVFIVIVL